MHEVVEPGGEHGARMARNGDGRLVVTGDTPLDDETVRALIDEGRRSTA